MCKCKAKERRERLEAQRRAEFEQLLLQEKQGSKITDDVMRISPDPISPLPTLDEEVYAQAAFPPNDVTRLSLDDVTAGECKGIDDDLALIITMAAVALAGFVLYRQITVQTMGRRRRKRWGDENSFESTSGDILRQGRSQKFKDIFSRNIRDHYEEEILEEIEFFTHFLNVTHFVQEPHTLWHSFTHLYLTGIFLFFVLLEFSLWLYLYPLPTQHRYKGKNRMKYMTVATPLNCS